MTIFGKAAVAAAVTAMTIAAPGTSASAQTPNRNEAAAAVALVVRLEVKPGKEADMIAFLRAGRGIVQDEPETTTWYAIRLGPTTFGIFDTFTGETGRAAHLSGGVAQALAAQASDLLALPPVIERADILASKIPE